MNGDSDGGSEPAEESGADSDLESQWQIGDGAADPDTESSTPDHPQQPEQPSSSPTESPSQPDVLDFETVDVDDPLDGQRADRTTESEGDSGEPSNPAGHNGSSPDPSPSDSATNEPALDPEGEPLLDGIAETIVVLGEALLRAGGKAIATLGYWLGVATFFYLPISIFQGTYTASLLPPNLQFLSPVSDFVLLLGLAIVVVGIGSALRVLADLIAESRPELEPPTVDSD
jgi:hypothetical protein